MKELQDGIPLQDWKADLIQPAGRSSFFSFNIKSNSWEAGIGFRTEYALTTQNEKNRSTRLNIFPTVNLASRINRTNTLYVGFSVQALLETISNKPVNVELVITGRYAPPEILDIADLVTEMKEVKHYYQKGIDAREGIEF